MENPVLLEVEDGIATITLNRPHAGNALDRDALHALMLAAIAVDEDPGVRCAILTGTGKLFCAGGDVTSFAKAGDALPTLMKEITIYLHAAVSRLSRMDKPLVTAINGAAAGAGLGLALLGDIVIASDAAFFTTAYSAIGLSPDGGVSWILPRLVGLRAAQEMAISSRKVPAEEGRSLGLVTRVVPPADLAANTEATARALADGSPPALGALRSLLLSSYSSTLETHLEMEARAISRMTGTDEARSLSARFIERRSK